MFETVLLVALAPISQTGEEAPKSVWAKIAHEHVSSYELSPASDRTQPFERVAEPVTQHVQNVRGNATGSVYIWRDDAGRPVAVCDVFFLPGPGTSYGLYDEWHSLTSASLTARWNGSTRWSPQEPGLKWAAIPDAGRPAASAARRNLQLRQLSRRFAARITTRQGERYELRMLPTPIFQFETKATNESLGGGLFAFCQGNDPETLLIIEARTHDDGDRWEYAAAEFSNRPQFLDLDGKTVWEADPPRFGGTGPHTAGLRRYVEIPQVGQSE